MCGEVDAGHVRGEADGMADLVKVIAELTDECFFGERASEKLAVGGQRIEEAKET